MKRMEGVGENRDMSGEEEKMEKKPMSDEVALSCILSNSL